MSGGARIVPWIVTGLAVVWILTLTSAPRDKEGEPGIRRFARLPVVHQGRCKPMDTLARTTLMILSGRQEFVDESGHRRPAIRWLLDVMTDELRENSPGMTHKVFRIESDQVLGFLGLPKREGLRYSISEFVDKIPQIGEQAAKASKLDRAQRGAFEAKILELASKIQMYSALRGWAAPHVIPPSSEKDEWRELDAAMEAVQRTGQDNPTARLYFGMLLAYAQGNAESFNQLLSQYEYVVQARLPEDASKADFEVFFNAFQPFYVGILLYAAAFLLICVGWLAWGEPLRRASLGLVAVTLLLHTFALGSRMYLQGRPPVTNLYSSAVFIGWGCVILGLILERFNKKGVGLAAASGIGFVTLIIAHHLAESGDTLEMMRAVLDTNFWLATHVTCITIGYSATFVAGVLGIFLILRGVLTRTLGRDAVKSLGRMIYGVVCFATLFSFTGTVLGGIWADQSWGRFWGWDPKENGALIIVLWNALILHARWGGMVRERGIAILAVFGNVVTAWSWFGVNMLGVGLHSYGFMDKAFLWLFIFNTSQLLVMGIGMLPPRLWRSLSVGDQAKEAPAG